MWVWHDIIRVKSRHDIMRVGVLPLSPLPVPCGNRSEGGGRKTAPRPESKWITLAHPDPVGVGPSGARQRILAIANTLLSVSAAGIRARAAEIEGPESGMPPLRPTF